MNTTPQSTPGLWAGMKLCVWSKDLLKKIRTEMAPNGWTKRFGKEIASVPPQWFLTKEKVDKVAYLAVLHATVLKEAVKIRIARDKDLAESRLACIMKQYGETNPLWFWKRNQLEREAREMTHLRDTLTGIVFDIEQLGPRTQRVERSENDQLDPLEEGTGKSPVMQPTGVPVTGPKKRGETPEDRQRGAGDDYPVQKVGPGNDPAPGAHAKNDIPNYFQQG